MNLVRVVLRQLRRFQQTQIEPQGGAPPARVRRPRIDRLCAGTEEGPFPEPGHYRKKPGPGLDSFPNACLAGASLNTSGQAGWRRKAPSHRPDAAGLRLGPPQSIMGRAGPRSPCCWNHHPRALLCPQKLQSHSSFLPWWLHKLLHPDGGNTNAVAHWRRQALLISDAPLCYRSVLDVVNDSFPFCLF